MIGKNNGRDFPGVQWLRLQALTAWDTGLIPSQETKTRHASGQKPKHELEAVL